MIEETIQNYLRENAFPCYLSVPEKPSGNFCVLEKTGSSYKDGIFTATLASIGTAGVPGAGMVMLAMVLTSVGLPVDGIALVAGVDRIFDMGRTTVNITGDAACTMVVSNLEAKKEARKAKIK